MQKGQAHIGTLHFLRTSALATLLLAFVAGSVLTHCYPLDAAIERTELTENEKESEQELREQLLDDFVHYAIPPSLANLANASHKGAERAKGLPEVHLAVVTPPPEYC